MVAAGRAYTASTSESSALGGGSTAGRGVGREWNGLDGVAIAGNLLGAAFGEGNPNGNVALRLGTVTACGAGVDGRIGFGGGFVVEGRGVVALGLGATLDVTATVGVGTTLGFGVVLGLGMTLGIRAASFSCGTRSTGAHSCMPARQTSERSFSLCERNASTTSIMLIGTTTASTVFTSHSPGVVEMDTVTASSASPPLSA
jgi:hypothetical protein